MADVLTRLRSATRTAHDRLEKRLDVMERVADPTGRRRLVERFYGLHVGAESALGPALSPLKGLDYAGRRRGDVIRRDLHALGSPCTAALPLCPIDPPSSLGEALGILYVLEGSTLGGRVIRRELLSRGRPLTGLAFLDPYGSRAGDQWRAFVRVLERESPPDQTETAGQVVRGGIAGFRYAESWLCDREGEG